MKKLVLSAFVLAAISLTSCKDEDETSDNGVSNNVLPIKITGSDEDNNDTTEFLYDSQNRLVKIIERNETNYGEEKSNYETVYTLEYQGDELVKLKEEKNSSYNGNQNSSSTVYTITKVANTITLNFQELLNGQNYSGTETLTVNEKGYLLTDEYYTYSYDAKGNMIKYSSDTDKTTFEYDDKNGILKNLKTPQWVLEYFFGMGVNYINNSVKYTYEDTEFPEDNSIETMTYQYNAAGYPVSTNVSNGYVTKIQYNK